MLERMFDVEGGGPEKGGGRSFFWQSCCSGFGDGAVAARAPKADSAEAL
jgi:hypothetical protein